MKRALSVLVTSLILTAWVVGMATLNLVCSSPCAPQTDPHGCGRDTYMR